jgi:hypothetical protein
MPGISLDICLSFHDRGNEAYFIRSMRRTDESRVQLLAKTSANTVQARAAAENPSSPR